MSADKLFIFALAACFFAFVIYVAWNSKRNEKGAAEQKSEVIALPTFLDELKEAVDLDNAPM